MRRLWYRDSYGQWHEDHHAQAGPACQRSGPWSCSWCSPGWP